MSSSTSSSSLRTASVFSIISANQSQSLSGPGSSAVRADNSSSASTLLNNTPQSGAPANLDIAKLAANTIDVLVKNHAAESGVKASALFSKPNATSSALPPRFQSTLWRDPSGLALFTPPNTSDVAIKASMPMDLEIVIAAFLSTLIVVIVVIIITLLFRRLIYTRRSTANEAPDDVEAQWVTFAASSSDIVYRRDSYGCSDKRASPAPPTDPFVLRISSRHSTPRQSMDIISRVSSAFMRVLPIPVGGGESIRATVVIVKTPKDTIAPPSASGAGPVKLEASQSRRTHQRKTSLLVATGSVPPPMLPMPKHSPPPAPPCSPLRRSFFAHI